MARTLSFDGQVVATPAAMTVTLDGTQIFSGAVGADAELDTDIILGTAEADIADTALTGSISISVTSGIVKIGEVWADIADGVGVKGLAKRSDILINGSVPTPPAEEEPVQPAEDWVGWRFELSAGETISFTCAIDAKTTPSSI